ILVGLVLVILAAEYGLDELSIGDEARGLAFFLDFPLEFFDILEAAQPAGDVASGKGIAIESRDHADHIDDVPAFRSPRLDSSHVKLPSVQAERSVTECFASHL